MHLIAMVSSVNSMILVLMNLAAQCWVNRLYTSELMQQLCGFLVQFS